MIYVIVDEHIYHYSLAKSLRNNCFFVVWTNVFLVAGTTDDPQALFSHCFYARAKDTSAKGLDPIYGAFPQNVYVFGF